MKRILLILLATILILLPSCTTIPDEPLSPVDSGNEGQEQPNDSDHSSDPRMTETQRQEIIDIIENLFGYNLSSVEGNLEADRFYESTLEATSFMHEGFDTIEKDPSAFEIFDETFFFPEANGEYVYLFFKYIRTGNVVMSRCVYTELKNGVLALTLVPYRSDDSDSERIAIFKIKKSSLESGIEQITYKLETGEEYIQKLIKNDKYLKTVNKSQADTNLTILSVKVFKAYDGRFPAELYDKQDIYHFAAVYDETELFPDAKGENLYVVFFEDFPTSGHSINRLSKAVLENGVLSIDVEWSFTQDNTTDDMAPRLFVVKIDKNSLPEEIVSAQATLTYVKK